MRHTLPAAMLTATLFGALSTTAPIAVSHRQTGMPPQASGIADAGNPVAELGPDGLAPTANPTAFEAGAAPPAAGNDDSAQTRTVAEPASLLLLGAGLLGIAAAHRRFAKRS